MDYREQIEKVLSEKGAGNGLHLKDIAQKIYDSNSGGMFSDGTLTYDIVYSKISSILASDVKKSYSVFSKVKNSKTGKDKKGFYKKKKSTGTTIPQPKPVDPPKLPIDPDPDLIPLSKNSFLGKAGECAVLSELLFRCYNVNQMMVDDGIDIVASKNNMFYFIQVKSTTITDKNRIYTTIKQGRFDTFIGTQIRYIIVARCIISNIDTNLYFVFDNKDIQNFIYNGCLCNTTNGINIKINIENINKPLLYHTKEMDISFYMNRFDL